MNASLHPASGGPDPLPQLPGSLHTNRRLSQWLRVLADGTIEVRSGKVDIGQGISTALAQIAAEELDLPLERIRMVVASTAFSPNEAVTSSSLSIQNSGSALRYACAEARAIYLEAAAARLGAPAASLTVAGGDFVAAAHVVIGCVVMDQPKNGFDQNNNTAVLTVEQCTAMRCGMGFSFTLATATGEPSVFRDNVGWNAPAMFVEGTVLERNLWSSDHRPQVPATIVESTPVTRKPLAPKLSTKKQ